MQRRILTIFFHGSNLLTASNMKVELVYDGMELAVIAAFVLKLYSVN